MTVFYATHASPSRYVLAESPAWVAASSRLLWVDVEEGAILTGRLLNGGIEEMSRVTFDEQIGAVVPSDDGGLLVAARNHLVVIRPDGSRRHGPMVVAGDAARTNDGGCDPAGRFLIGTYHFDERAGEDTLQRLEFDGSLTVIDNDLSISNGLAWSPDGTLMYSTDTGPGIIWVREYDVDTGAMGPRSRHLKIDDGHPDGLCIDAQGTLWIAIWGAGEVRSFSPDGVAGDVVKVPVPHVSSVAFVGDSLDTLLITTSSRDLDADGTARFPNAGRLFLVDVTVTGQPTAVWKSFALN